jgi:membrane-associated phospholipid phosphatase
MRTPRDIAGNTEGLVKAARIFSNIISPPVIFAGVGMALSWAVLPFWEGLIWAVIFGFWVSLMPSLLVGFMLRTGRITDLHMSNIRDRRWPDLASVVGSFIALATIHFLDGPELLRCLAIFAAIELSALAIITNFWLISIHATSMSAASIIIGLVYGWETFAIMLPMTALVVWIRLFLRRHDIYQVVAGLGLGAATVAIVLLLGCFQ